MEDQLNAAQIELPTLQAEEFFRSSGRLELFGKEIFRLRDGRSRSYILSPTNEEVVAALIRRYFLPLRADRISLYQIDRKFRDEMGGGSISRAREFRMMELYTVHRSAADVAVWRERIIEVLATLYKGFGCRFDVLVSRETVTSRLYGHRSVEFRVKSRVRTGISDAAGRSLLELAKWSPMGQTYLKQDALEMSCLGAGAIRLLLHLFELEMKEKTYSQDIRIRWPLGILPIAAAVLLPDAGSRFEPSSGALADIYARVPRRLVLLDDRTHIRYSSRVEQLRRLGLRHLFVAGSCGRLRHQDTYLSTECDLNMEEALAKMLEFTHAVSDSRNRVAHGADLSV
jgi:hypothetical protein